MFFLYKFFLYSFYLKNFDRKGKKQKWIYVNRTRFIVFFPSFCSLGFFFLWVVSQFSNCVKVCALGFFILQNSIRSQLVNISPVCVFSPLLLRTPYTPPVTYFHQCARVCRQMCLCDRIWNIHCRILAVLRGKE